MATFGVGYPNNSNLDTADLFLNWDSESSTVKHNTIAELITVINPVLSVNTLTGANITLNADDIAETTGRKWLTTAEQSKITIIKNDQGDSTFLRGDGVYSAIPSNTAALRVTTIADRDAAKSSLSDAQIVTVDDASADQNVSSGQATYIYNNISDDFKRLDSDIIGISTGLQSTLGIVGLDLASYSQDNISITGNTALNLICDNQQLSLDLTGTLLQAKNNSSIVWQTLDAVDQNNFKITINTTATVEDGQVVPKGIRNAADYNINLDHENPIDRLHLVQYGTVFDIFDRLTGIVDAEVIRYANVQHTYSATATTVEVGTTITASLAANFDAGLIQNGDGSAGPALVGNPTRYTFTGAGITAPIIVTTSNTSANATTPAISVGLQNINWSVTVDYQAGTGEYTDSVGTPAFNLDNLRIANSVVAVTNDVQGRYYTFFGTGSLPTNSSEVRALTNRTFLNLNNTGTFSIDITKGQYQIAFAIPAGKTVRVYHRHVGEHNIACSFTKNTFAVNDAAANTVSYDVYTSALGITGYTQDIVYDVEVT